MSKKDKKNKQKLLWISDFNYSGYTLVSNILIPFLQKKYDIYILVINSPKYSKTDMKDIMNFKINNDKIYKITLPEKTYNTEYFMNYTMGIFEIPKILKQHQFKYIFSINDYQILAKHLKIIKKCNFKGKTIVYMPIDAENYKKNFLDDLNMANYILTMTENSKNIIQDTGVTKKIYVLEHAVNNIFEPLQNKQGLRQRFFGNTITDNDFLIMNVNVNAFRKRLDLTLESFYLLHSKYKFNQQIFLVMKTGQYKGNNYNFNEINKKLIEKYKINLSNRIIIKTDKYDFETLNKFYNCADMYISTTSGEGWGLTAFEFLQSGVFCLVPDNTAYTEYFHKSNLIKSSYQPLSKGRTHLDNLPQTDIYVTMCQFYYNPIDNKIEYIENIENIDCSQIILKPNSEFTSFKDLVNNFSKIPDLPHVFKILLLFDIENNFKFVEKNMSEYSTLNLLSIFKDYHIQAIPKNNYDFYITKVKIVDLDDMVDKMYGYIQNPVINKELLEFNTKMLSKLTNEKIGKNLLKIFSNFKKKNTF
jgi:hypothetical protein